MKVNKIVHNKPNNNTDASITPKIKETTGK